MRAAQITFSSLAWLLPSPLFWKTNEVLVRAKSRDYTFGQLEDFFIDLNHTMGWEMRKDSMNYTTNFTPPGVEVHCLYGRNVSSVESIHYKKSPIATASEIPELIYGDGDGTVNIRSLEACLKWRTLQTQPVIVQAFDNVDHMGILSDKRVLSYIENVLNPK